MAVVGAPEAQRKSWSPFCADSQKHKVTGCPLFWNFLNKILNIPKLPWPVQETTSLLMNTARRLLSPAKRSTVWTIGARRAKHWQSRWLRPVKMGKIGPKLGCHVWTIKTHRSFSGILLIQRQIQQNKSNCYVFERKSRMLSENFYCISSEQQDFWTINIQS